MTATPVTAPRGWTRTQRIQLSGILAVIALLHVGGWSLYLSVISGPAGAGAFAGADVLAYVLGIRHAFDADHIAAIDDTTRLMRLVVASPDVVTASSCCQHLRY